MTEIFKNLFTITIITLIFELVTSFKAKKLSVLKHFNETFVINLLLKTL